jgi:hypothetical protein
MNSIVPNKTALYQGTTSVVPKMAVKCEGV